MGEAANKRSRHRSEVLAGTPRCIYCENIADTIEHMPPRSMFRGKSRPDEMVYPACRKCNDKTRTADLVAAFFSRLVQFPEGESWKTDEAMALSARIGRVAPEVLKELLGGDAKDRVWVQNSRGVFVERAILRPDGPHFQRYLATFSAKMGMALFREHTGAPLDLSGAVLSQHFLNAGLAEKGVAKVLEILPTRSTLVQGRWSVGDQFAYRFNSDGKSIVAALSVFQGGLAVFSIATNEPDFYLSKVAESVPRLTRPGDFLK